MDGRDGDGAVSKGEGWELRLGRWQDVLADVECDALITDPPYSERTHSGHDCFAHTEEAGPRDNRARQRLGFRPVRARIEYQSWSPTEARHFAIHWADRCRGWVCIITDHTLAPHYADALESCGRYVFAPLPIVETGSRVRLSGDGPSSWTCWLIVSRPKSREFQTWGTLPGAYIGSGKGDREHVGGKDSGIMRAIIRDYTRPDDLVCDPCAGAATTLLAAVSEGRRAIGSEMDPDTYAKAVKRLQRGHTPPLFTDDLR